MHTLSSLVAPRRLERLKEVAAHRTEKLTIVLDRVFHEHNISAVVRSADAFGLAEVHVVREDYQPIQGITMGTDRWVTISTYKDAEAAVETLKARGFELVVVEAEKYRRDGIISLPVSELPFDKNLALVLGGERAGVEDAFVQAAAYHAYIPMRGFVESLNVSVAASICLFCSTIEAAHPARRCVGLSEEQQEHLVSSWISAQRLGTSPAEHSPSRSKP